MTGTSSDMPNDGAMAPPPRRATNTQKTVIIAVIAAVLGSAISGVVTARLTDRQSALTEREAQIDELRAQASQRDAEFARLTADAADAEDAAEQMTARIATLEEASAASMSQIETLQVEKAALEEQLNQILNPPAGPVPTASLTALWVRYMSDRSRMVCVEIENTSDADTDIYYSYAQFTARNLDGFVFPPELYPANYASLQLLGSGDLAPGDKRRGTLFFSESRRVTWLVWESGLGETGEETFRLPKVERSYNYIDC
jgi:hypothetical protein